MARLLQTSASSNLTNRLLVILRKTRGYCRYDVRLNNSMATASADNDARAPEPEFASSAEAEVVARAVAASVYTYLGVTY